MLIPSTIIVSRFHDQLHQYLEQLLSQTGNSLSVNNPDLLIIDQTSGWTIDQVRQIKYFLSRQSIQHPSKHVIIYDAHQLNTESQNALLKTIEEPPPSCYIILVTPNPKTLLPTILSRCHILRPYFPLTATSATILQPLTTIPANLQLSDKITIDKTAVLPYLENQLHLYHQQLVSKPSTSTHHRLLILF